MKRSEMLEVLKKYYRGSDNKDITLDNLVEDILGLIEFNGMIPPTYEEDCCPEQFKGTELEGSYTAFIPEWEPEDDKD